MMHFTSYFALSFGQHFLVYCHPITDATDSSVSTFVSQEMPTTKHKLAMLCGPTLHYGPFSSCHSGLG
eukprot:scaffold15824_cov84-Skeletonema_dohrnii-CCMP3373.AAC.2